VLRNGQVRDHCSEPEDIKSGHAVPISPLTGKRRFENRTALDRNNKVPKNLITVLIFAAAAAGFSEDFKTVNGKEFKDATITRVEPDGIVVKTKSGMSKVYFAELPKEVQERFHYDPQKASTYSAEQAANYTAYQNQQAEAQRQREEVAAKNNAILAQQQAAKDRTQTLQDRYATLQQEENALLLRIGEAKQPGPEYWQGKHKSHHPNPQKSQLPLLQSQLSDVRHEKGEVRKQLEKAQR
jgi:sRNA-binding protein